MLSTEKSILFTIKSIARLIKKRGKQKTQRITPNIVKNDSRIKPNMMLRTSKSAMHTTRRIVLLIVKRFALSKQPTAKNIVKKNVLLIKRIALSILKPKESKKAKD